MTIEQIETETDLAKEFDGNFDHCYSWDVSARAYSNTALCGARVPIGGGEVTLLPPEAACPICLAIWRERI